MVKQILIVVFVAACFMVGCKNANDSAEIKILKGFRLSPLVDSLFKEYVKEVPDAPAYAICMDKREGMLEYVITIAPFGKRVDDLYATGTTSYFMFHDTIPVLLYSGMENFVQCDSSSFAKAKKLPPEYTGEFSSEDPITLLVDLRKSWSYVHRDTVSYVVKGNGYPFMIPLTKPTVEFVPPDTIRN